MTDALTERLRAAREANVLEHMDSENRHEYDATIETFGHPRYEIIPTGDVFDGEDEVRRYFAESRTAHDPLKLTGRVATVLNHPLTISRALVGQVTGR